MLSLGHGAASAQTAPEPAPASDPLRGPAVEPAGAAGSAGSGTSTPAARKTLVKRDFNGTMEVLDTRPEVAALELLTLSPEEAGATKALLERRAAIISRFLADHRDLFLSLQGARQSGAMRESNKETREKIWEFRKLADPLLRPALMEQIAPLLTDENKARFRTMVAEYTTALAAQEASQREGPAQRTRARDQDPQRVRERAETGLLLREIARTLRSVVESRREKTESFIALIQPDSPEQEARIREAIRRIGEAQGTSPTHEQQRQMMAEIQSLLTPEQQGRVRRELLGRDQPQGRP